MINPDEVRVFFRRKHVKEWGGSKSAGYWRDWRYYAIYQCKAIGSITLSLKLKPGESDDESTRAFWYDLSTPLPDPRPIAVFQFTEEEYWGLGVQGILLKKANPIVKARFGLPISSSDHFVHSHSTNPKHHPQPAMSVWEKLEEEGYAVRRYYSGLEKPLWVMK